jgi:hypothetical protein
MEGVVAGKPESIRADWAAIENTRHGTILTHAGLEFEN